MLCATREISSVRDVSYSSLTPAFRCRAFVACTVFLPCPIVTGCGERAYALRDSTCSVDGAELSLTPQHRDDVSGESYLDVGDESLFPGYMSYLCALHCVPPRVLCLRFSKRGLMPCVSDDHYVVGLPADGVRFMP